jgi:hypothetical protein
MRAAAIALLAGAFLIAGGARADEEDEAFIEKGIQLRKEHRDAEALEQFRRAEAIRPTARIKAQIALAEQAIGKWVEAERDLQAALAASDDRWIASRAAALRGSLEAIRQHIGTLVVKANVDGAELWLNGERLGELPMNRVRAPSGTVHIEVRAGGYVPALRNLDLEPSATTTTEVVLQRVPEPANPVVVQPPLPSSIDAVPAPPKMTTQRMLAWGALGGSVLLLGGALAAQVMHGQAATTYNDDALCAAPGQWRDDRCGSYRNKAETAQIYANLGYIGAGALGVASAILFLVDTGDAKAKPRAGMTWAVAATGSGAEFVAAGRW